jgi:hypothetical protein
VHGPGAVDDTLLPMGNARVSSNLRGCSKSVGLASSGFDHEQRLIQTQRIIFSFYTCIYTQYKLGVEWKITLLSFELVDIPHDIGMLWSRGRLNCMFVDLALELSVFPVLRRGCSRITCACRAHFHHHRGFAKTQTREIIRYQPTGDRVLMANLEARS